MVTFSDITSRVRYKGRFEAYVPESQMEFFRLHPEINRSEVVRQALDRFISDYEEQEKLKNQ